jgi:ribosome biogenesis GTPase A
LHGRYGVEEGTDVQRVLDEICKKRGYLQRQGEIDEQRGARALLDEFRGGKLGRITLERCDGSPDNGTPVRCGENEAQRSTGMGTPAGDERP